MVLFEILSNKKMDATFFNSFQIRIMNYLCFKFMKAYALIMRYGADNLVRVEVETFKQRQLLTDTVVLLQK